MFLRKPLESQAWKCINTKDCSNCFTIPNLPIKTHFVVRICACNGTEKGPLCDESEVISTKNLAFKVKDKSYLRQETLPNSIPMYDVPHQVECDEQRKTRIITIGNNLVF